MESKLKLIVRVLLSWNENNHQLIFLFIDIQENVADALKASLSQGLETHIWTANLSLEEVLCQLIGQFVLIVNEEFKPIKEDV